MSTYHSPSAAPNGGVGPTIASSTHEICLDQQLELPSADSDVEQQSLPSSDLDEVAITEVYRSHMQHDSVSNLPEQLPIIEEENVYQLTFNSQRVDLPRVEDAIQAYIAPERGNRQNGLRDSDLLPDSNVKLMPRERHRKKKDVVYCLTCFVIVAMLVGVSLGVSQSHKSKIAVTSAPGTPTPTEQRVTASPSAPQEPTVPPTQASTSFAFNLVAQEVLNSFGTDFYLRLQDLNSPQAKAARWMGDIDTAIEFPVVGDNTQARKRFKQRYSLATFFYSTGGEDSWVDHARFLSPNLHECNWNRKVVLSRGVLNCNNLFEVAMLAVPSNNLTGTIPPEIIALDSLESIYLVDNNISGSLPDEIYSLTNLVTLQAPYNKISGALSSKIGKLLKLQALWLQSNKMVGPLPTQLGLLNLTILSLRENAYQGTIPRELEHLSSLLVLDLGYNELSSSIPDYLGSLKMMQTISLDHNRFTGRLPSIMLLDVASFSVSYNLLTGQIPSSLLSLSLELLDISGNFFTGTLPSNWIKSPSLSLFSFQENNITGSLPSTIGTMQNLQSLNGASNSLTGTVPKELANTQLTELTLQDNQLSGSLPTEIEILPLGEPSMMMEAISKSLCV